MKRILALSLLAAATAFSAHASDRTLSLTYVDAYYQDIAGDADGYGARGSIGFGESNWYAHANFNRSSINGISGGNFNIWHLGVGYSLPIAEPADWVFDAAYQTVRASGNTLNGYRVGTGVRGKIGTPQLEGHAKALYYTGGDLESQWAANLGINWFFTSSRRFSLVAEYEFADGGDDIWLLGLRSTF